MPTIEECTDRRVESIELRGRLNALEQRIDAQAERLDEAIGEMKAINKWLTQYGTLVLLIALLGDKAIPLITKIL